MLWSDLFPEKGLVARLWYRTTASGLAIVVPARATILRVSMVGGGAQGDNAGAQAAAGAAFARKKLTVAPGDAFTLDVADVNDRGNTIRMDTLLTRNADSAVVCKAAGAVHNTPGSAADCIGDTKRSGTAGSSTVDYKTGGSPGSDDGDAGGLGFGGPGARGAINGHLCRVSPNGGGGVHFVQYRRYDDLGHLVWFSYQEVDPGPGGACIEFFTVDPGY